LRLGLASLKLMGVETHDFDLAGLRLTAGEGRRMELSVRVQSLVLGGERYSPDPPLVAVLLDVSRMTGGGYALALRFQALLAGPCMRCLGEARPSIEVRAREVDRPGGGEELSSPYLDDEVLNVAAWAHDALVLAVPVKVICHEDCAGLCPVCAADLNETGPRHAHERTPDPRWAKLRELKDLSQ